LRRFETFETVVRDVVFCRTPGPNLFLMRGCIPESFGGHYRVTVDPQVLLIGGNGGRSRR
jgi:hypothetical protein